MAITRKEAVTVWADRWRNLRAWGRSLDSVRVEIRESRTSAWTSGTCWPARQRVVVTAGMDMAGALKVVLHEYAHAAVRGDECHGEAWQVCFAAAVEEVTGIPVVACAESFRLVNKAAGDAMRAWWRSSGQEHFWRLASGAGR